jgi:8-oxo-dGTP diphosphatase
MSYCRSYMKRVRTEIVVVGVRDGGTQVLLVRLPGSVWALPGVDVAAQTTLEAAARAALADQTGIRGAQLEQLYTFDREGGEGVLVAHLCLVDTERHVLAPGPGVVEVRWFPMDDPPALDAETTGVVEYGRARVRAKAAYAPIALQLLAETFTLGDLQGVYEAVLGHPLDTRNFRRDVLQAGVVEPTGSSRADGPGRPAALYRSRAGDFQVLARERRIARAIAMAPDAGADGPPGRR